MKQYRLKKFRAFIACSTLFACIALGMATGSAQAAAGCRGRQCNGKDPIAMGCVADARNVNRVVFDDRASGGTFGRQVVTLRYSRRCNASWARVTSSAGGTASVTSTRAYMLGYSTSTRRTRLGPGSVYSKMRSGSAVAACGRTVFSGGNVIEVNCASAG